MSHPTHETRYSDSSHYDTKCVRCGATDGYGCVMLDLPCPEYREPATPVAETSPGGSATGVELADIAALFLHEVESDPTTSMISDKEAVAKVLTRVLERALSGGFALVPSAPHPADLSYACGLSDLSDISANPPNREATERELAAFYRIMVERGARRLRAEA